MTPVDWVHELEALATRLNSADVRVQFHADLEGPESVGWASIGRRIGRDAQVTVFQSGACNLDWADSSTEVNDGLMLESPEQLESLMRDLMQVVREGAVW